MITLNKFVHLYRLKESKEFGYYKLVPWDRKSHLVIDLSSSFCYWKSRYFFVSGDGWETSSDDFWGDVPRLLRRWETPCLGAFTFMFLLFMVLFVLIILLTLRNFFLIVKERPKLEDKFEERVLEVVKYASTIEDFDKLVDPHMLAHHYLGPEPSPYVLRAIDREKRKRE